MFYQLPENTLVNLLRQCYRSSRCGAAPKPHSPNPHHNSRSFKSSTKRVRATVQTGQICKTVGISKAEVHNDGAVLAKSNSFPRSRSSISDSPPKEIAILGGGITGLASAFYL